MGRRMAVLLSGHGWDYVHKTYGGLAYLFTGLLSEPGETWEVFSVINGFFPSEEDLNKYDAFVITGSRQDAHSNEEWVLKLCELIRKLHKRQKKLLGICFGHQVICRALGGKTGRAKRGWDVGLRKVALNDALNSKFFGLEFPSALNVIEVHQDEVFELPPGGEILASSETTSVEIFAVGDHILGIQGHPEFTLDVFLDMLDYYSSRSLVPDDVINKARDSLKEGNSDREILQKLCKFFLKGSLNLCMVVPCF